MTRTDPDPAGRRTRRERGVSLLELLAGVAILGVLASFVLPGFGHLIDLNRRTAAVNEFVLAAQLARTEALVRGTSVVVCPSGDGLSCADHGRFESGWLVFADTRESQPPGIDSQDRLIRVFPARVGVTLRANRQAFVFRPFSRRSTNGTVRVCTSAGRAPPRAVIVSTTGRPRTAPVMADGRPIPCPASAL